MGCTNCSCGSSASADAPKGCGSNGSCSTGGCNRLNTYDWLADIEMPKAVDGFDIVEVSFKHGARKSFFKKTDYLHVVTGDYVLVESYSGGFDIGRISLMGELVRLQMKKRKVNEKSFIPQIIRRANQRDIERMEEARLAEKETMVKARVIARKLNLQMKIGDVEYQGDRRKVTFYYTADGRVDFRELIRIYAKEFKVKIEMRQIGARQESARIGGIGACGRELCCSTWLSDFKSVSTVAARYQNLAINQAKLSGQCGRLKCCLNYELNTYFDALKDFPRHIDRLKTRKGEAILIKTDIFKRIMYFVTKNDQAGGSEITKLPVEHVKMIRNLNKKGVIPENLQGGGTELEGKLTVAKPAETEKEIGFVDGTGIIELKELKQFERSKGKKRNNKGRGNNQKNKAGGKGKKAEGKQSSNQGKNANTGNKKQEGAGGKAKQNSRKNQGGDKKKHGSIITSKQSGSGRKEKVEASKSQPKSQAKNQQNRSKNKAKANTNNRSNPNQQKQKGSNNPAPQGKKHPRGNNKGNRPNQKQKNPNNGQAVANKQNNNAAPNRNKGQHQNRKKNNSEANKKPNQNQPNKPQNAEKQNEVSAKKKPRRHNPRRNRRKNKPSAPPPNA